MKKNFFTLASYSVPVIIIVSCFSCWSPFEPVTHIGKDVVSSLDSNVTDLGRGFKVISGLNLAVQGAHTVTPIGPDTSIYHLTTGVHSILLTAGTVVGERSIAYAEIHTFVMRNTSIGIYQQLLRSPDSTIYKAYLMIYYYPQYSDTNTMAPAHTSRFSVYSCPVKNPAGSLLDTNPANATLLFSDTMNSKIADTFAVPLDSNSVALINKAVRDTTTDSTKYDTTAFYIKSLDTGALFRFSVPYVRMHFKTSKIDTTAHDSATIACPYFDINVFDSRPADSSLVASWEADRFIEIPIFLKPLWDSITTNAAVGNFKIVQAASCSLFTESSSFEKADTADTSRSFVYGLLDHKITNTKTQTLGARDSLIGFLNSGRLATDTIHSSPTKLTIPLTIFLQSLSDENPRPDNAYLYLFVRPVSHFGRVVVQNMQQIKFSALFSNSHK